MFARYRRPSENTQSISIKSLPRAAKVGLASLMRPEGPLSDVPFVDCRYAVARKGAAAVIAAMLARWRHVLSFSMRSRRRANQENLLSVSLQHNAVNPYRVAARRATFRA